MKHSPPSRLRLALIAIAATSAAAVSGCTSSSPTSEPETTITVSSSDDTCEISAAEAPAGALRFTIKNIGSQATEFYVLGADGLQVVAEVENIGPGLSRDLMVQAAPGTYQLSCKPGMVGDGIRSPFTVTDSGTPGAAS